MTAYEKKEFFEVRNKKVRAVGIRVTAKDYISNGLSLKVNA